MPDGETVAGFARHGTTMAVYLSGARPEQLRDELRAGGEGYADDTPAAVVVRATWPDEQVVLTTVGDLPEAVRSTGIAHHRARAGRPRPGRAPRPAASSTTRPTPTATGGARRRARRWGDRDDGRAPGTATPATWLRRSSPWWAPDPGDPDLLTLRAEALLAAATVVVTDAAVAHLARAFAPAARVDGDRGRRRRPSHRRAGRHRRRRHAGGAHRGRPLARARRAALPGRSVAAPGATRSSPPSWPARVS